MAVDGSVHRIRHRRPRAARFRDLQVNGALLSQARAWNAALLTVGKGNEVLSPTAHSVHQEALDRVNWGATLRPPVERRPLSQVNR